MNRYRLIVLITFLALSPANAQFTPYAGQENREIKTLSTEDIDGYLDGKGMGLAKAAELNHYPGPLHVRELADKLQLTQSQREQTQVLFERMKAEAIPIGRQIVEKERQLDELFAQNQVNQHNLRTLLQSIASLQSELRFVHLAAHLEQKAILTPHQVKLYDEARVYTARGPSDKQQSHPKH